MWQHLMHRTCHFLVTWNHWGFPTNEMIGPFPNPQQKSRFVGCFVFWIQCECCFFLKCPLFSEYFILFGPWFVFQFIQLCEAVLTVLKNGYMPYRPCPYYIDIFCFLCLSELFPPIPSFYRMPLGASPAGRRSGPNIPFDKQSNGCIMKIIPFSTKEMDRHLYTNSGCALVIYHKTQVSGKTQ